MFQYQNVKKFLSSPRISKLLTLPVPNISEGCIKIKLKFLFSHFFAVPQKVLRRLSNIHQLKHSDCYEKKCPNSRNQINRKQNKRITGSFTFEIYIRIVKKQLNLQLFWQYSHPPFMLENYFKIPLLMQSRLRNVNFLRFCIY